MTGPQRVRDVIRLPEGERAAARAESECGRHSVGARVGRQPVAEPRDAFRDAARFRFRAASSRPGRSSRRSSANQTGRSRSGSVGGAREEVPVQVRHLVAEQFVVQLVRPEARLDRLRERRHLVEERGAIRTELAQFGGVFARHEHAVAGVELPRPDERRRSAESATHRQRVNRRGRRRRLAQRSSSDRCAMRSW